MVPFATVASTSRTVERHRVSTIATGGRVLGRRPKALPLGLRDREVAAPSLSYREPPSTRSVVVYIGGVATRSKKRAQASIEIAPGGDWHIVPLAGLCALLPRLAADQAITM